MIDTKELRRLAEEQQWIGRWYDAGCETLMAERNGEHEEVAHLTPIGLAPYLVAVQPAATTELLERLEAAEKERDDVAMQLAQSEQGKRKISEECNALLARIEEMERQEPVAWVRKLGLDLPSVGCVTDLKYRPSDIPESSYIPLYLAPGAQPTPSIPEGWKLVPTAESRHPGIYKMLSVLHAVDNTPGASEWESYAAFLAAAPEAKP
jgi:hypothetical protein